MTMINTRSLAWTIILCLAFPISVTAQAETPSTAAGASQPIAVAKPVEQPRPFFSWPWLGICVLAAGAAFVCGKVSGKQDHDLSDLILNGIIAGLPDDTEIEYEIVKITSGRFKQIVRVLLKQPDGTGKLTTTERESDWHDLPDEIRGDLIRTKSDRHIRSFKNAPNIKEKS